MERIVKHITKKLTKELPNEQESYQLSELHASGIPRFVVKRVEVELERNLGESIVLPETEWADMESETVRQAWDQFVSAIRAQARLPQSYSYAVLETALSDIMDILVQPRKNLPDVIFGAADELEYHQVVERMDAIVVYRHFGSLIPRYMEKKGINTLTRQRCTKIISQADEKLTARYTPLNWAQMLEPLFTLMDEQIDSNMLRLFFEDKKKPRLAREFDLMNRSLNRSQFIEVLSSPNLPVDDDEQNELFDAKTSPPHRADRTTGWEGLVKPVETETGSGKKEPEIQEGEGDVDHPKEEEDVLNQFYEGEEQSEEEEEEATEFKPETEKGSLNEFFTEDNGDETEEEVTEEQPAEEFWQPFSEEAEQEERRREDTIEFEKESPDPEDEPAADDFSSQDEEEAEEFGDEDSQEHDAPMWQKFMSSQDLDESEAGEDGEHTTLAEEQEQHEEEKHVEEEPLIDLTEPQGPDNEEINQLRDELQDDRDRFVEDIFRGADEAYEQALEEIAAKDNWRSASRFIHKEIFKRNLVDMYSETAVDFTDRLHSYFIKTDKSK